MPAHDAGGEVDQREALRAEEHFVQRSELVERPRVRRASAASSPCRNIARDQAPQLAVLHEAARRSRPSIDQFVVVRCRYAWRQHFECEDDGDDRQQRHRHRSFASHQRGSIIDDTRRMSTCANRGKSSFSRMNSSAPIGRMRRYFPSSAALAIARRDALRLDGQDQPRRARHLAAFRLHEELASRRCRGRPWPRARRGRGLRRAAFRRSRSSRTSLHNSRPSARIP